MHAGTYELALARAHSHKRDITKLVKGNDGLSAVEQK